MADETVIGQQAAQIVVPREDDAVEIEGFALEPVDRIPDRHDRRYRRKVVVRREAAHAQTPVVGNRDQVADRGEALAGPLRIGRIIDAAQIHQLLEAQLGFVAQHRHHGQIIGRIDVDGDFAKGDLLRTDLLSEMFLQVLAKQFKLGGHCQNSGLSVGLAGDGAGAANLVL